MRKHKMLKAQSSSYINADTGKGPMEGTTVFLRCSNAAIQRTEENIRTIAETNFCSGIVKRQSGEPANIGNDSATPTDFISL